MAGTHFLGAPRLQNNLIALQSAQSASDWQSTSKVLQPAVKSTALSMGPEGSETLP